MLDDINLRKVAHLPITVRRLCVIVLFGPFALAFFVIGALGLFPLLIVIGMLMDSDNPVRIAWEIVTEPPVSMFAEMYAGRDFETCRRRRS